MISDKRLKIISLVVSLAGIFIIFLVSMFTGHAIVDIGSITEDDVGKYVMVNATIGGVSLNNGNLFIEIYDGTGKINAVMFERTARGMDLYSFKEKDSVLVEGQVNTYKGKLEIIASSIKLSNS